MMDRPRSNPLQGHDRRASSHSRGYNSRWRKARRSYLAKHPLCVMCKARGKLTTATVVDHIKPHKGDQSLFWDVRNWQSLCEHHHSSTKQAHERSVRPAIGLDGWPEEPNEGGSDHWARPSDGINK